MSNIGERVRVITIKPVMPALPAPAPGRIITIAAPAREPVPVRRKQ